MLLGGDLKLRIPFILSVFLCLAGAAEAAAVRALLLDDLSDGGAHAATMETRFKRAAPDVVLQRRDAGRDLRGEREALAALNPSDWDLIVFGTDHQGYDQAEYDRLAALDQAGVLLVAPAGNRGDVEPLYPASYPFVLAVGASDGQGRAQAYSSQSQNLKLLLPESDGTSFAAAALAGHAARLLARGADRAGLAGRLLKRRRGHGAGARAFIPDDGEAAAWRPAPPPPAPRRRQAAHALLLARHAPGAARMAADIRAAGARVQHLLPPGGAVVLAPGEAVLERLRALDWVEWAGRGQSAPARDGDQARVLGAWKDLFWGGLEARGLGATGEPGGAPVGCTEAPLKPLASGGEALRRQGRWAPSPPYGAWSTETSVYLAGRVAVGVFLAESNGFGDSNVCNWTAVQEAAVQAKIMAAMGWMAAQNPSAQVEFVYDWHFKAACDYEPIKHPGYAFSPTWTQNIVSKIGYSDVRAYDTALRISADADWAFSIFVANDQGYAPSKGFFTDGKFAFAYLGGPYEVMTYTNDNWGIANMDSVCAHESGHIFNALDEYAGPASPTQHSGYFWAANDNAVPAGTLNDPVCPMRGTLIGAAGTHYCSSTRLHLGWRDQDSDGRTDVLDTLPYSYWVPPPPALAAVGAVVALHGFCKDMALTPLGPSNPITLNAITAVEYRVNGGGWSPASIDDGAGDESVEPFTINVGPLAGGSTLVEVRGINSAGNTETAYLTWTLSAGSPTPSATASPSRTASATATSTPSASPSRTVGPYVSPSVSPTLTPSPTATPSPMPGGGCLAPPDVNAALGSSGLAVQPGGMHWIGGRLHAVMGASSQLHLAVYDGAAWSEAPAFPLSAGVAYGSVLDPGSGALWLLVASSSCSGCNPGGDIALYRWDGSALQDLGPVPVITTYGSPMLVFHQGRPWVVEPQGITGMRYLSYSGGAWAQEAWLNFAGGLRVPQSDAHAASTGSAIVISVHNLSDGSGNLELWAYTAGQLLLLHDFGGTYTYSYTAAMLQDPSGVYFVFAGSRLRGLRVDPATLAVTEISTGLNDLISYGRVAGYAGGDGIFCLMGRSHPSPWLDLLRFDGSRWNVVNCGATEAPNDAGGLLVEGGRAYSAYPSSGATLFNNCPAQPDCPDLTPTYTPTPGPYWSPTSTATPPATKTRTPWPTASSTPTPDPYSPTPTPTPTAHTCGQVLRVCLSGACPYLRIADAIAAACPGDRIEVEGGTYGEESLLVDKALEIVGVEGYGFEGPIPQPKVEGSGAQPSFFLDLGAPRSVTLTNLALRPGPGSYAALVVSATAGSLANLERLDLKGGQAGVFQSDDAGDLRVLNSAFWGYEGSAAGIRVANGGLGGRGAVHYNSFLTAHPGWAVKLDTGAAYPLDLRGNLVYNAAGGGVSALDLMGNPSAAGDYEAWWGYSAFHGGLAPGANDLGPVLPDFGALADEDPHYSTLSSLAYGGEVRPAEVDLAGDTRPASGHTRWSIGAVEPVTPSLTATRTPSFTATRTPSPGPSAPASPSATITPLPSATASATPSPSPTPSGSPSPTRSASPTASGTASATRTASVTASGTPGSSPSATLTPSPSAVPSPSQTAAPSANPTATASPSFTPSPAVTATLTPGAGAERPRILRVALVPNPNPGGLQIRLSDPADDVVLRFYTPNMVLLEEQRLGPVAAGWTRHGLAVDAGKAWRGTVFLRIRAEARGETADAVTARAYYVR